jgi:hypothetical protein
MFFLFFFLQKNKNLTEEFDSNALFGVSLNVYPLV